MQYHSYWWRYSKGIFLEKLDKKDHTLRKSYYIISLKNCLGKVLEKVVAEQLSDFCEVNKKLHQGQIRARKYQLAINVTALLIHKAKAI